MAAIHGRIAAYKPLIKTVKNMEHLLGDHYHGNSVSVNDCALCPYNLGERGGKIWCDYYNDFVKNCACGGLYNSVNIDV